MVPPTLADYRILRPIGAGGMREIYLAESGRPERNLDTDEFLHSPVGV